MKNTIIIFASLTTLAIGENLLPEDFTRCRQKDAKLNDCLKGAVPDALRRMTKGIPALSVPPLEPLLVSGMNIETGAGPVVISQVYRNIQLHGLTDSRLTSYKADLKHYRLRTDSITPKMDFIADYVMKGRILVLPIQGKGVANITMVNLVVKHDLIGEPVIKDGETYMHIKDYKVKFIPERVILHFSNLFNGDKALGDNMNKFLNQNSDLVFNELKESYEKSLSSVFQDVTNKIFDKVPMNKIFPEE
ncbi:PREDICTED: protein takeout-like [Papilio xuthus]|uniref:Protein takeout-like n=1 Tax=Papilio xuthus TaxID=66420 RepID=I4DJD8_PAPXU|nr:protein takeout-like precursor [Papilio xuthus]BAM18028.1 takeout/JHBP like protein [Papilio xuthus]